MLANILAARPIDRHHPLARGLTSWFISFPGRIGGQYWYDLQGLNHGTFAGSPVAPYGWNTKTRPGSLAGSVNFNGSSTRVTIPGIVRPGDYAIACWMNQTSNLANGYATILTQGSARGFWTRQISATTYNLALNDLTETRSATTLNTDTWYHVLVSATGGTATYYINGLPDANHPAISGTSTWDSIGNDGIAGDSLKGFLDDVRIYNNRFFTAAEAFELYNNSRLGCPGLLRVRKHRHWAATTGVFPWWTYAQPMMGALGGN